MRRLAAPLALAALVAFAALARAVDTGYSDDMKHRLYQAAAMTGDAATVLEVSRRIGILREDGTPGPGMQQFCMAHGKWAQQNVDFITKVVNTQEKARAYCQQHGFGRKPAPPPPPETAPAPAPPTATAAPK